MSCVRLWRKDYHRDGMNFIRTTVKCIGGSSVVSLVAVLVWANWEEKSLHAYVKPINMAIFKAADLQTAEEANSLSQQIQRLPGVRDCSANPESRLVAISY